MSILPLHSQIDSYRIDALIGRGGMAEVYKAWHTDLHCYHALKVLQPSLAADAHFAERFLDEAREMAKLKHPNITTVHTVSASNAALPYFVMELIEGEDLAEHIAARGRLPLEEARPILQQIGATLDYVHSRGVIHRDVKPANVLLRADGKGGYTVKVLDFGIARAMEETDGQRRTRTGMIIGTPEYMSPEQGGSGARVDHRTDIYSLGVIAYEMLCGYPPFRADESTSMIAVIMAHINTPPPNPRSTYPSFPHALASALLWALAKQPEARPSSCAEFVAALHPSAKSATGKPSEPTGGNTGSNKNSFLPLALVMGTLLLAGVALVSYQLGSSKPVEEPPMDGSLVAAGLPEAVTPTPVPPPSTTAASSEQQLKELVENWRVVRQNRDGARIARLYSPQATKIDGKSQTMLGFRNYLLNETSEQHRVTFGISNVRIYPMQPGQARVVFSQHFKGWGYMAENNWESWGTRTWTVWRGSDGWKIAVDSFKRDGGRKF